MTDSNEVNEDVKNIEVNEIGIKEINLTKNEDVNCGITETVIVNDSPSLEDFKYSKELVKEILEESIVEKEKNSSAFMGALLSSPESTKNRSKETESVNVNEDNVVPLEEDKCQDSFVEKIEPENCLLETESKNNIDLSKEKEIWPQPVVKKIISLPDGYTDSSQSSSSELQSSAAPFESSCSSQENNYNASRINFENAIQSDTMWRETNGSNVLEVESSKPLPVESEQSEEILPVSEIPVITIDDSTEPSASGMGIPPPLNDKEISSFVGPGFPPPGTLEQPVVIESQSEIKAEEPVNQPPPIIPLPAIPPAPRKRGRPRKQVLPNPSPIVESWGPNAQEFSLLGTIKEGKRSARAERRQAKKKKFEEEEKDKEGDGTPRKRFIPKPPVKKKRKSTYIPKKKLPPPKKKHSEMENIQNFEEETRMSATEGPTGFSSKQGATGDESQGSSVTAEGHTKSNINKKGRMEVMTDGCKPVTVQQIVEYHWPPPSTLPHSEKPEALMIQEQISEYLGVKSFKRKYPSIKRRPVDMEERNYLQENGYVSENMCDMGLTAVFSADILEIMYNDFPNKFEEYRKYSREKKAKEQRALREKQAAERADMDPKKEAVESAFSWNSEFNKTRRFKILHMRPEMRFSTDGMPCPPFERVIINLAPVNAALCAKDDHWKMSLFSYECEIAAHTVLDSKKQYSNSNKWMFLVGSGK